MVLLTKLCQYLCEKYLGSFYVLSSPDGNPLACAIIGNYRNTAVYLQGFYRPGQASSGLMSYVLWECIRSAKEKGCTVFDFEGSMREPIERFFRKFAAKPVPYLQILKNEFTFSDKMAKRLHIIGTKHSYLNHILYELRDKDIQKDRMRFRFNLEKMGEILGYEISKKLAYKMQSVTTPLGSLEMSLLESQPVLISILRAGLPLHLGFLRLFDRSDNGFISAYRHHITDKNFVIKLEYLAAPELSGRSLILIDPMIATGQSICLSYKQAIQELGTPAQVFVAGAIGSEEGVEFVQRNIPQATIYIGAVDDELTGKGYIVPGLGDAGDLAFGEKED